MENTSKALLIAAAVLIVIVIIALGVKLIGDSKDTLKHTDDASSQISDTTNKQSDDVFDAIAKLEGYTVDRTIKIDQFNRVYCEEENKKEKLYWEYYPGYKVDENSEYIISFDYEFKNKDNFKNNTVFWSIRSRVYTGII